MKGYISRRKNLRGGYVWQWTLRFEDGWIEYGNEPTWNEALAVLQGEWAIEAQS